MATQKVTRGHVPPPRKRTSIGLYDKPKNKGARRNWKRYRGQGRP